MSADENGRAGKNGSESAATSDELAGKIEAAALQGRFSVAEQLRDELIRIDPMNLKLIVSTGELIEEQKTALFDKDHLAVWQELYQELSDEEANGLFYSLESADIAASKLLQVKGKISNRLFFVESGNVALFYPKDGKNTVLTQLSRGDIVGELSFFEISLCPLSAATQSEVKLYSLTRAAAEKWQEPYPGLYDKLERFCRLRGKSDTVIKASGLDRRTNPRYQVDGIAGAVVLDKSAQPTELRFKGPISDMSSTGLCFEIKCSKQETARYLLAKTVELHLEFDQAPGAALDVLGRVSKVSFHLHNDYSVHVQFNERLGDPLFEQIPRRQPEA